MGWKHYQTVDPHKREPLVSGGLFGIRLLILQFTLNFFNFSNPSNLQHIFHIFLNLTYPLRKKKCFSQNAQKSPKNLHKTAKQWLMK